VPNITDTPLRSGGTSDIERLRRGETLPNKTIRFEFKIGSGFSSSGPNTWRSAAIGITAYDFATTANTFVGDRPLDNPGYSKLVLTGSVGFNGDNKPLDVLKVEQRLKYLGFPALGTNRATDWEP
jgi:hypothetical protein